MLFRIDKDSRRLKNLIDAEILYIRKKVEDTNIFQKKDIEELDKHFKDTCKDLTKIDKNITEMKLRATGEINIREYLKENKTLDLDNLTGNQIRNYLDSWTESLLTTNTLYDDIILIVCTTSFLCEVYLNKANANNSNVNFEEVEKEYE